MQQTNKNQWKLCLPSAFPAETRCVTLKSLRHGTEREEGSGWGTHVYLWRIHVDTWQNQYNIVKLKKKKRMYIFKKKE